MEHLLLSVFTHEKQTQRNTEKDIAKSMGTEGAGKTLKEGPRRSTSSSMLLSNRETLQEGKQRSHSHGRYMWWVQRERSVL